MRDVRIDVTSKHRTLLLFLLHCVCCTGLSGIGISEFGDRPLLVKWNVKAIRYKNTRNSRFLLGVKPLPSFISALFLL